MKLPTRNERGRILDFDIENMPLTYYAPDYPTAYITAIAWAFTDKPKDIEVRVIEDIRDNAAYDTMLFDFLEAYDEASLVTGHYIRKHDLPIINSALVERGFYEGLSAKLVSDTKEDLIKFKTLPKNQEYLSALVGVGQQKVPMTQFDWREANRFTPKGIAKTRKRVVSDVRGNMQLRDELIDRGYLKAPRMWRP